MRDEISKLLEKEGILSKESLKELSQLDIHKFFDNVKELGEEKTEHIQKEKITKDLNTSFIGKEIYIFKEVMSTNTVAKFFAENKVSDGTVIISEKQTNAKGRSGKPWDSPLGGVWLSIILNPRIDYSKLPMITLATGVAVAKTLERLGIEDVEIKWPNDVLINGEKVSGILTEAIAKFNTIESIIVGVGLDVNLDLSDFSDDLQGKITSLKVITGKQFDENDIIRTFLEEFEKICKLFIDGEYENVLNQWRKRSYTIGKIVEVRKPYNKTYDGYVTGINKEGALIVEKIDGTLEKVVSGECIIKN